MNYPHSTRKLALAVAIASSLAIAGCDTSNEKVVAPPKSEASSFVPGVAPRFNPFTKDLPLNIDLLFNGTTDGTADAGSPDNAVISALNDLDGFSTTAYFDIAFDGSIDPASVVAKGGPGAGQNVYLVPLDTGAGDALPLDSIVGVDAAAATAFSLSKVSATVVSLDGGTNNVLRVAPEEPLLPGKKYLVFTNNTILDASGNATTSSGSYFAIKDTTNDSLNPALLPVRSLINDAWEAVAGGFINAFSGGAISVDDAKAGITIAYSFTTTDPHKPLLAMAAPRAAIAQSQIADGVDPGTAVGNAVGLDNAGLLSTPKERALDINAGTKVDINVLTGGALAAGVAELYTGYIELPSYLPVASSAAPFDPSFLIGNWTADLTLAGAIGKTVPADSDGSYNVTYRYPFAAKTTDEAVPLQVTLPNPTHLPSSPAFGGASCGMVQAGSGGYPVVIYLHGITSDRTSVVALAHALASNCVATVAIDLPVHGVAASSPYANSLNIERAAFAPLYAAAEPRERHYNIYSASNVPTAMDFANSTGGSGGFFINLGRLQNTRDNLRQGVMDMLNLNASLSAVADLDLDGDAGTTDIPLFDLTKVYVVGVSLGGSVGTVFTSVNQQAIDADAAAGLTANLNPIAGFVASTPANQLAQVIVNSQTIGPQIIAGLAASGVVQGTSDFEKFLYAAQATVDSGDPVNFAQSLAGAGVPVLIQQIVGGGDASALGDTKVYTADKVVPNSVADVPLVGTTPLATLLGAAQVGPGAQDLSSTNGLVNLTIGHHASLLRPSEDGVTAATNGENVATAELQTQVVSFVLSAATQVGVGSAPGGSNTAAPFIQAPAPPTP